MNILVVVDMQYDFIDGSLGTKEAQEMLPRLVEKLKSFEGKIFATRDTHEENYLATQEGKNLPVPHCIKGSKGWEIHKDISPYITDLIVNKPTFGSVTLGELLGSVHQENPIDSITFTGLCTDICVISNAMITKAYLPEVPIIVDSACCAGVTPQTHIQALEAMKMCQIQII